MKHFEILTMINNGSPSLYDLYHYSQKEMRADELTQARRVVRRVMSHDYKNVGSTRYYVPGSTLYKGAVVDFRLADYRTGIHL